MKKGMEKNKVERAGIKEICQWNLSEITDINKGIRNNIQKVRSYVYIRRIWRTKMQRIQEGIKIRLWNSWGTDKKRWLYDVSYVTNIGMATLGELKESMKNNKSSKLNIPEMNS